MQPEQQIMTPKLQLSPLQLPQSLQHQSRHQIRESEGLTISLSSLLIILLTLMILLSYLVLVCHKLINMWPLYHLHNGTAPGFILSLMLLSKVQHLKHHWTTKLKASDGFLRLLAAHFALISKHSQHLYITIMDRRIKLQEQAPIAPTEVQRRRKWSTRRLTMFTPFSHRAQTLVDTVCSASKFIHPYNIETFAYITQTRGGSWYASC